MEPIFTQKTSPYSQRRVYTHTWRVTCVTTITPHQHYLLRPSSRFRIRREQRLQLADFVLLVLLFAKSVWRNVVPTVWDKGGGFYYIGSAATFRLPFKDVIRELRNLCADKLAKQKPAEPTWRNFPVSGLNSLRCNAVTLEFNSAVPPRSHALWTRVPLCTLKDLVQ